MKIKTMIGSVVLFCTVMTFRQDAVAQSAANYVMPQELVQDASKEQCGQVANFYKRPGMFGPPYAYLSGKEGDEISVAFWCEKTGGAATYLLIVRNRSDRSPFARCPDSIETKDLPGGLSIRVERELMLDTFMTLKKPSKRGPGVRASKPLIVGEYDGVSERFYCHEGEWLVLKRH
jgi:hypothetical protein